MTDESTREIAALKTASTKIRDNRRPNEQNSYTSPRWDVSQERAFIETLVGHRLGFLLVFFALVVGAAVNARSLHLVQLSILLFGTCATALLAAAIGRAQKKLDLLLGILKQDPEHPVSIVDDLAGPSGSRRKLIGYAIPWLCVAALLCAAIASGSGYLPGPTTHGTPTQQEEG